MHNASQQALLTSACVRVCGCVLHVKKPQKLFKLHSQVTESWKMPDLQVFNLFSSTPHDPACAAGRTGELLLSWETMLLFESSCLADTSQFSRMPHRKTNSFFKFGAFRPTYEWNSLRFWLFLRNSSLIKSKSTVMWGCSTSVFTHDWEGLGLILYYWSTVITCAAMGSGGCLFPKRQVGGRDTCAASSPLPLGACPYHETGFSCWIPACMTRKENNSISSIMNSLVTKIILQKSFGINVDFIGTKKVTHIIRASTSPNFHSFSLQTQSEGFSCDS